MTNMSATGHAEITAINPFLVFMGGDNIECALVAVRLFVAVL